VQVRRHSQQWTNPYDNEQRPRPRISGLGSHRGLARTTPRGHPPFHREGCVAGVAADGEVEHLTGWRCPPHVVGHDFALVSFVNFLMKEHTARRAVRSEPSANSRFAARLRTRVAALPLRTDSYIELEGSTGANRENGDEARSSLPSVASCSVLPFFITEAPRPTCPAAGVRGNRPVDSGRRTGRRRGHRCCARARQTRWRRCRRSSPGASRCRRSRGSRDGR